MANKWTFKKVMKRVKEMPKKELAMVGFCAAMMIVLLVYYFKVVF